ncbi:MAG TPA: hypothetical protein VGS96_12450 [Thermoanaerobaculia bacterium]|nr:hypothetical protein [Thermoanaerobaculia bacterium]
MPDRSVGLILFGILQILIGLACSALVLFIASGSELAARQGAKSGAAMASGLVVYGLATVYFVGVGVGSIRKRRWARALSVVVSAIWLAAGIVTTLLLVIVGSNATLIGGAIVFAILLPLVLLLFYSRPAVRATCEAFDAPRWTDRVPLPVLAVVIVLAFASLALMANLANPSLSFAGQKITGAPAALTLLGLAILCAWLAVQLYRLKESAWWVVVMLQVIGCVIAGASFMRESTSRAPLLIAVVVASWLAYFAYLLFIRRYFAFGGGPQTRRTDIAPRPLT